MVLLGDGLNWKLAPIRLETVLILTHNMYSVHAKQIIGTEIVLEAPDGTNEEAQLEACFSPFGHSANLDTR
jgi:hypothetical protein